MKKGSSFKENIEFLIMMYKRELNQKDITWEEKEIYETFIIELETIIEFSK